MRDDAQAELDQEPEYTEVLDYNGKVIWGMKRDRIVEAMPYRPSLEAFLEETATESDVLRELFQEAIGDLEATSREDDEVEELVNVVYQLIEELTFALGYVRSAGSIVRADMGLALIERARVALKAIAHMSSDQGEKTS